MATGAGSAHARAECGACRQIVYDRGPFNPIGVIKRRGAYTAVVSAPNLKPTWPYRRSALAAVANGAARGAFSRSPAEHSLNWRKLPAKCSTRFPSSTGRSRTWGPIPYEPAQARMLSRVVSTQTKRGKVKSAAQARFKHQSSSQILRTQAWGLPGRCTASQKNVLPHHCCAKPPGPRKRRNGKENPRGSGWAISSRENAA